ncbi:MAG: hypothetical protein K2I87_07905 [Bacteroidales bacterium]|nr:hypothetical protein [Bacteroidales bacterium]
MKYEKEFNAIRDILYPDWNVGSLRFAGEDDTSLVAPLTPMILRCMAISETVTTTIRECPEEITIAKEMIKVWINQHAAIRILGAGRALLAASLGANRLAHAGTLISFMGGMVPMPNSILGGGIIAASASGQTRHVIEAMKVAKEHNPNIKILGFAKNSQKAVEFMDLCDCFIGLRSRALPLPNPLFALADEEEMAIAELLDGLVVLAGQELGFTEEMWRLGHEDIGPTGPYSVRDK